MRSSKNRSRSKGNRNRSMGNIVNRVFDSSGPEGKVRGTPQQIIDKYNQLTRDAQLSNDRVAAENFQQHAEHYTRMLGEAQREQEARRAEQDAQQQQSREARQSDQADKGAGGDKGAKVEKADRPDNTEAPETRDPGTERTEQKSFDDVIDAPGKTESGLVETPESAPKPKRSRSRRAPRKTDESKTRQADDRGAKSGGPDGDANSDPQAAE
ncbi:MAG: DUF4167 domain-containing protein [Nioella sp.]